MSFPKQEFASSSFPKMCLWAPRKIISCLISTGISSRTITEGFVAFTLLETDGSITALGSYSPDYYVRQSMAISKHFLFEWSTSFAIFDTLQTGYGYKVLTLLGEL